MNARAILQELDTQHIKTELMRYPEVIKMQKDEVRRWREQQKDVEFELAIIEADIMANIVAETNGNGKPKFSNDKARQAELLKRKHTDPECQELIKKLKHTERELERELDELERLQDEFKSCRYIARLAAEEIALWAGREENEEV